ncbi:MAG: glutamyl-tRNA reductase [Chloroflexota bacterium]|nr:glutamyl-tRNA reductase [Chloroflexota bacterium]
MEIVTIGLDCKKAPVEVREKVSFSPHLLSSAFEMLGTTASVQEAVILSTCNRVELYILSEHVSYTETYAAMRHFISKFHEVEEEVFSPHLYYHSGRKAVQHLFEVAGGIQSMVIGEAQIQGQVREAIELARKHGGAGRVMDALFRSAISAGKRARTETSISESGVSVSYTAIELLEEHSGSLSGKAALVVGGGKTARLTAQIMLDKGVSKVAFVNRSEDKVRNLALLLGQTEPDVAGYGHMTEMLSKTDLVVTCTGAPHTVVHKSHVETALRGRERPIYMVDIAVPRDIEPDVRTVPGAFAWDIDDVKVIAEANLLRRCNEVGRVRTIVQEEVDSFMQWLGSLAIVPTITGLRQHADAIRQAELKRIKNAFGGDLNDRQLGLLDELTNRIVNKLLHEPTLRLKEAASSSDAGRYAEVVQHLFSLQGVRNEAN